MKKILAAIFLLFLFQPAFCRDFDSLKLVNSTNWPRFANDILGLNHKTRGDLLFYPSDIYLLYKTVPEGTPFTIKDYNSGSDIQIERIPYFYDITSSEEDMSRHAHIFQSSDTRLTVYPSPGLLIISVNDAPYAKIAVKPGPKNALLLPLIIEKEKPILWDKSISHPTKAGEFFIFSIIDSGLPDAGGPGYTLFYTQDGIFSERQVGKAPADLTYDQKILIKDLVWLLTIDGPDDFEFYVQQNKNLSFYKSINDLINSKGKNVLLEEDARSDPRAEKAYYEFKENRIPRTPLSRKKALGIYGALLDNNINIQNFSRRHEKLKKNWPFLKELKEKLKADFDRMGILSLKNRQNVLEDWLSKRLEFKKAHPPNEAKYIGEVAFATFFKPEEKLSVFTKRESDEMRKMLQKILSGEAAAFELKSVNALNEYNLGRLLNEILGDLYKSHGCLHVSPRNSYFIYEILPVGAKMTVHKYSEHISAEAMEGIPRLADIVNFSEDLDKLKNELRAARDVRIEVYPQSGYWILFLKDKPFARLAVKGGPQKPFYVMQGRDSKGKPVFEKNLAYPTTPGKYFILRKITDYVSNIYRDTTIIPMGAQIGRTESGWAYTDKNGKTRALPKSIENDINRPPEAREFAYYDAASNASDEVVEVKWGSHPFGKYSIQTSIDEKNPFPELIHSSGDLIMEERQIINDIIALLSAPYDELEDCVSFNPNFNFYKICHDFTSNKSSGDSIDLKTRAAYKLHYDQPLTTWESTAIPEDVRKAVETVRNKKFAPDMQKTYGLYFDNYQYAVAIEKYANHYEALSRHWDELNSLRRAMLYDFNNLVIKDPVLFYNFMRELMLSRNRLEKISNENAFKIINSLIERGISLR